MLNWFFSTDDGDFDVESLKKLLNTLFEDKGHYVTVADKKYSVYFDQTSSVVYFLMFPVSMKQLWDWWQLVPLSVLFLLITMMI